ncbi:Npt1/Npt2 family nucleotide transporter [Aliikangiella sp. G2MR2-5]|uniref:Npt1/Npt2 family nucleotide transporter n=1 Tax=Aliikangiella sp. G2MR2-5 TaxID=2788943 RepID=UPI0018AA5560|nr:Npt1/Npt2 family nucleotide transporter [Aliikangiella sp. G2MR2-5]
MSIRFKLSSLILILFIAAILNSVFFFRIEHLGQEKIAWIDHTHSVLYSTEKLLSAIKDAETGHRGYLLTEDIVYLKPYYDGLTFAKEELNRLTSLTSNKPLQQNVMMKISEQFQLMFKGLANSISLVQEGKRAEALKLVSLNESKAYMDSIRDYFSDFTKNELILLEKRKGDYREYRTQITTIIVIEVVLFIGLALITFQYLNKSLFSPLKLLVKNAEKVKKGEAIKTVDIVGQDEMGSLLSTFYDMGEKVYQREQKLAHEVKHDSLTGLKNRSTVLPEIEESISRTKVSKTKTAILFIDLDSFKQVNDTLGHEIGDLILKQTASKLASSVRSRDSVFRLGGDEFLVIVKDLESTENVITIIQKIRNATSEPLEVNGSFIDTSLSIGVSISPDDSICSTELIKYADIAMYASKKENTDYKLFRRDMLKRASDIPLSESLGHLKEQTSSQ